MDVPFLESRIESVTVYRMGARVARVASLPAGTSGALRIAGLPLALDDDSVRVRVEPVPGAAQPLPVARDLRVILSVPPADPGLAPPRDEALEDARTEVARLEDEIERVKADRARIKALTVEARPAGRRGEPPPPSPFEAREALIAFRRSELDALLEAERTLDKALEDARRTADALAYAFEQASSARLARDHELRKAVALHLEAPADGPSAPARLVLEYLVPGARWAPAYTVRFAPDFSELRFAARALVCQRSGEDWSAARLVLSTARALSWTDLPELPSRKIGRRQAPPRRVGWREPPPGVEALFGDYDRSRGQGPPPPAPPPRLAPEPPPEPEFPESADADFEEGGEDLWEAAEEAPMERRMAEHSQACPAPASVAFSAAPPAPPRRPAPMAKKAAPPRGRAADRAMGGAPPPEDPAEEAELDAPADLLRYATLRMPGPGEPGRGRLRPADPDALWEERLAETGRAAEFSVGSRIRSQVSLARDAGAIPLPVGHAPVEAVEGFDYAFWGEVPVDVPSDGSWHSVPLLERAGRPSLLYVTVPREGREVFRTVSFQNPLDAPLLPGPADVYLGGDFALSAPLHTVGPGGAVDLGLGVEEGIKVARNARFEEHAAGLLGGSLELRHEVEVEVANHLQACARLEVRDRIPTARAGDDEVAVTETDSEPAWEPYEQKGAPVPGGRRWRVEVPPGSKKTLTARYVIRISSKKELEGGNRREA